MATFIKTILPSNKGLWLEKLNTRQYRAVAERVTKKLGDTATAAQVSTLMAHEMLLASIRGVTAKPIDEIKTADGNDTDIDAMLASVHENDWLRPTFEQLITEGPLSLDELLCDASDYLVAEQLATTETLSSSNGGFRGKVKREFVER